MALFSDLNSFHLRMLWMLMSNACVKLQAKIGLFGSREEGKNVKSCDMCALQTNRRVTTVYQKLSVQVKCHEKRAITQTHS